MGFLGNAVKRVEDPALLRGKASFTDNIHLPGQLYVAFVRSYEAHARIRGIDTSEALAVPGVVAVFTAADLEPVPVLDTCGGYMPVPGMEQPLLAGDKVHFVGEAVAAVVASSRYAAADGVAAVEVDYEPLPAVIDPEQALAPDAPVVFEDWGSNLIVDTAEEAMPDDLFAEADVVIEMDIANQRVASASLEPRSVLVGPHPETGELTLWSSNQHPQKLHSDACALLGLDSSELRVIAPDVGGGFGAKSLPYPEEILLVLLARRLGQPVT
ncbi:MAG TPA: molybdopterin cofactor-binding domain-containing protein, partial [Acidimicrobiales bacterium]|nr:molybdopterin cofactor-binding domain-containing protein [Acidimicrobiales bacterium]